MKKTIIAISILAAIIILIVAIFLFANQEKQAGLDKVSVRLRWIHQAQFAGFYTAEQKGFYEKQNLNVQINPGGPDFPAIQSVIGGEDFGITGADQILEARSKSVPVVAIATIYRKNPMAWISINPNITTATDLIGKKVGLKTGSNSDIVFNAMLKNAGVDKSEVNIVPVSFDISPLLLGQIDAYEGFITNEALTIQEKGHQTYLISPSDYNVNFYADTLFTTENMIKNNPDLVKRFVIATLQGWNYAYDNPDEAVSYTLPYSDQLTKEHETKMMQASLNLLKPDTEQIGHMDRKIWEDMQRLLLENGFMKNPVDIDQAYTSQFLD